MPLNENMRAAGDWLFRWRSFIPLAAVPLLALGLEHYTYLFGDHRWDMAWEMLCLSASLLGLGTRVVAVGFAARRTSGRNTRRQVADSLNTTGIYSIVRHPLYLGNFLVGLGPALFLRVPWIPVVYCLAFALYYERIILAEEAFLTEKFGEPYLGWASATPALIPRFRLWAAPVLPFNLRRVLRREYRTLFCIIAVFYLLEVATDTHLNNRPFGDELWNDIGIASVAIFLTLRALHKYTSALDDRGEPSVDGQPMSMS